MSPGDIHQRLGTSVVVMTGGRSYWHGVGGDAAQRPSAQDGPPQRTVQPPWLAPALGGGADLWVLASPAAPLLAATLSPLLGWAFAPALSLVLSGGRAQDLDPEIRLWGEGAAGSPSPLPAAGKGDAGRILRVRTQHGSRLGWGGRLNLAFDLKESLSVFRLLISRLKQFFALGVLSQHRRLFAIHGFPTKCHKRGQVCDNAKKTGPLNFPDDPE